MDKHEVTSDDIRKVIDGVIEPAFGASLDECLFDSDAVRESLNEYIESLRTNMESITDVNRVHARICTWESEYPCMAVRLAIIEAVEQFGEHIHVAWGVQLPKQLRWAPYTAKHVALLEADSIRAFVEAGLYDPDSDDAEPYLAYNGRYRTHHRDDLLLHPDDLDELNITLLQATTIWSLEDPTDKLVIDMEYTPIRPLQRIVLDCVLTPKGIETQEGSDDQPPSPLG